MFWCADSIRDSPSPLAAKSSYFQHSLYLFMVMFMLFALSDPNPAPLPPHMRCCSKHTCAFICRCRPHRPSCVDHTHDIAFRPSERRSRHQAYDRNEPHIPHVRRCPHRAGRVYMPGLHSIKFSALRSPERRRQRLSPLRATLLAQTIGRTRHIL